MSWVGLTTLIVLLAAALFGAVLYAGHRGKLDRRATLIFGLVIFAGASVVLLYPSVLTLTHEESAQPR